MLRFKPRFYGGKLDISDAVATQQPSAGSCMRCRVLTLAYVTAKLHMFDGPENTPSQLAAARHANLAVSDIVSRLTSTFAPSNARALKAIDSAVGHYLPCFELPFDTVEQSLQPCARCGVRSGANAPYLKHALRLLFDSRLSSVAQCQSGCPIENE